MICVSMSCKNDLEKISGTIPVLLQVSQPDKMKVIPELCQVLIPQCSIEQNNTKPKRKMAIQKALKVDFGLAFGFFLLLLVFGDFGILINLVKF